MKVLCCDVMVSYCVVEVLRRQRGERAGLQGLQLQASQGHGLPDRVGRRRLTAC